MNYSQTASMQSHGQSKVRWRMPGIFLRALFMRLLQATETARQRRQLSGLSDEQLKDIGLTRADVAAETARPFWRIEGTGTARCEALHSRSPQP